MIEFFLEWGLDNEIKSSVKGYFENECLVVEYFNTLANSDKNERVIEFEGNIIKVELRRRTEPDIFSAQPAFGWIVERGPNPVSVEEGATGVLVICQASLS